jgi:hypothetical protein
MTITTTVHSVFTTHVPIGNTSPAIANTPVPDVNTFVPHANTIVPSVNVIPHVSRHKNATTVTVPYNLPTTIVTVPRSTIPSVPSVAPGAGAYTLVKDYSSSSFFDEFNFFSGEDPTHGFVEYILL